MKKIVSFFCGVLSAVCLFSGCSGSVETSSPDRSTSFKAEIYMPDGAPALSMAQLMTLGGEEANYHVVSAATIEAQVTGKDPKADVCVLPLDKASKLLGTGESYRLLGTVTHGNLYILSTDTEVQYTTENLNLLIGKTVGVVQLPSVPGLTFKVILEANDVPWQELGNDGTVAADKVNLKAVASAENVVPNKDFDCFVVPEPAASLKASKTPLGFVGDLQALYGGEKGYPQAVLVAKKSLIESHAAWVADFTAKLPAAAEWLTTAAPATIVSAVAAHLTEGLTPSLNEKNLTAEVISHCGIRFESAAACKAEVNAFLDKLIAVNPNAAAKVNDAFYYEA